MSDQAPTVHLSIGEVLSLVQEEFPDVTISKIRFLESQGLIAPERTASGYRKFYDPDIDQLRWILRQQRDHFLPLKVIKKMIDQGADTGAEGSQQQLFASGAEPEGDDAAAAPSPNHDRRDAEAPADAPAAEERSPAHPAVASSGAVRRRGRAAGDVASADAPSDRGGATAASGGAGDDEDRPPDAAVAARPAPATPADIVAALQEEPGGARRRRRHVEPAPSSVGRRSFADANPSAGRLSRDELLEAAGIDDELLDGLEQYGLVLAVTIGAAATYDADALEIARIAGRYAQLGVEARHLRMYKVAAEREAGFVEQLVVPLVKQRNPTARQHAVERCDELAAMGSDLHQALLRRHLGPLLGP